MANSQNDQRTRAWLKYIVPQISVADFKPTIWVAVIGGLVGGCYGIIHDQITYAISSEYFTKLKFHQFQFADFGFGDHVFASTIGFIATWWVGFFSAWLIARRLIPNQPRKVAYAQIKTGILCVFLFGLAFGVGGYFYGVSRGPDADYSSWNWAFYQFQVTDRWAFVRVAYIHNAGYLGGVTGLILALLVIRPEQKTDQNSQH